MVGDSTGFVCEIPHVFEWKPGVVYMWCPKEENFVSGWPALYVL